MKNNEIQKEEIIYDWNIVDTFHNLDRKEILLFDETLRDGLQSPSVINPKVEEKLKMIFLMEDVGIHNVNIGLPGAGEKSYSDCLKIAKRVANDKLKIKLAAAARTLEDDIRPIVTISQKAGIEIEVMSFIGSSPIRQLAEEWNMDILLKYSANAIDFATREYLPVTFVTEDTTRSRPANLYRLFKNAIDHGAKRLCLCDTVGHVTPDGIRALMRFVNNILEGLGVKIGIDWHGHNDRGMSLTNSLWALQWGADRVHGTALGIGERVGNTPMDQLIVNLKLLGGIKRDVQKLLDYCMYAAKITGFKIPTNYPVVGRDSFRTATGVHASAMIKALKKGDTYLSDRIYSGVPAGMFGKEQEIEIGPMSGMSNVIFYLQKRNIPFDEELAKKILEKAKKSNRILTENEIKRIIFRLKN